MATVATLRVAPVKGLATVERDRILLDEAGVAEDRRIFLLDRTGSVVTLRSHPQLIQVTPDLNRDHSVLTVQLRQDRTASSALDTVADPVTAQLYGKERRGHVLPGSVAELLTEVAGEPIRVVVAERTGVGWDEGPVSILGRASAIAVGGSGQDRARYRMLVELEDTEPYEEDTWIGAEVELGDATVRVTHQLERCVIITQSPTTGAKDWDGLHALAEVRGRDHLCLGVIADVVRPGHVHIGSAVRLAQPLPERAASVSA